MARLVGVDLPRDKRMEIALTYIYGIGRTRSQEILAATDIDVATHAEVDIIGAEVDRARAWREQLRAKQAEAERAAAGVASGTPRRSHSYPGRFS